MTFVVKQLIIKIIRIITIDDLSKRKNNIHDKLSLFDNYYSIYFF